MRLGAIKLQLSLNLLDRITIQVRFDMFDITWVEKKAAFVIQRHVDFALCRTLY